MRKVAGLAAVAVFGVCGLAGCTQFSDEAVPGNVESVAPAEPAPESVGSPSPEEELHEEIEEPPAEDPEEQTNLVKFGEKATLSTGLEVKLSTPEEFTPSESAYVGDDWDQYVTMKVTVTNGSEEAWDPSFATISATTGGADTAEESEQVFDSEQLGDSPTNLVLPGRSINWDVGFGRFADEDFIVLFQTLDGDLVIFSDDDI